MSVAEIQAQLDRALSRAADLLQHGQNQAKRIPGHFHATFADIHEIRDRETKKLPPALRSSWESKAWNNWNSSAILESPWLRFGGLVESRPASGDALTVAAFAPFIGQGRTVLIRTDSRSAATGAALMQSLVVRTALLLPHQARYTFIDPDGGGHAFPMRMLLQPNVRENSGYTDRDLRDLSADIRRVIGDYLGPVVGSFEKLAVEDRAGERFQFVFAADFPNGYEREDINQMIFIGNNGPKAGVYLFIHHNTERELPGDKTLDEIKNLFTIDLTGNRKEPIAGYTLRTDPAPPADVQHRLLETIQQNRPPEPIVEWNKAVGFPENEWWKSSSAERVEAPIGARGGSGKLRIIFGVDDEGVPCVHGLLAALPGAGKSSLYHTLITSLAIRYSPDELRFYLIDGKQGVEFAPYHRLPHAKVLALHSQPDLSRNVLEELLGEMSRRNDLFKNSGVADFSSYRKRFKSEAALPRLLLIVDEYQQLFEDDKDGQASEALLRLTSMGRSAGIHVLLGSQRFTAVGMEKRQAILANFHLRIGMRMQRDEVEGLTEFGRKGKNLLHSCDSPGKVVINGHSGDDSKNVPGKVALLESKRREQILDQLVERAGSEEQDCVVLDGTLQPAIVDNRHLRTLLAASKWLNSQQLERIARNPIAERGFGIDNWFAVKGMRICWLGQPFTVRGMTALLLRREASENVLLVGNNDSARYGMLIASLVSAALNLGPGGVKFAIFDRSPAGSQWAATLEATIRQLLDPSGFSVDFTRQSGDLPSFCERLTAELERRRQLPEEEQITQPSVLIALSELDSVDWARRMAGPIASTESAGSKILSRLYQDGPAYGMHTFLSLGRVQQMDVVLEKRELRLFGHRVALQMSEGDSFSVLGDRSAAKLKGASTVPVCAAYRDLQTGAETARFKPYSTEPQGDGPSGNMVEQLRRIAKHLASRPEK